MRASSRRITWHAGPGPKTDLRFWIAHLELVQILNLAYQIALEVEDFEVWAHMPQEFDGLNVLLMQRHLLKSRNHALIMLCALHACMQQKER